jgi:hypothetical protein
MRYWLSYILCCCCILLSCKKQQAAICSLPSSIMVVTSASHPCNATGTIAINNNNHNFLYKLNNGAYEQSNFFTAAKAGENTITLLQQNVCGTSKTIFVDTVKPGIQFTTVARLLAVNCSYCHSGNNPQAGLNWLNPCDILQYWDRIKARAVDATPTPMPPTGILPAIERNIITNWINAGHTYSNYSVTQIRKAPINRGLYTFNTCFYFLRLKVPCINFASLPSCPVPYIANV